MQRIPSEHEDTLSNYDRTEMAQKNSMILSGKGERDGWKHVYVFHGMGKNLYRPYTRKNSNVTELVSIDEKNVGFIFIASPVQQSQRLLTAKHV